MDDFDTTRTDTFTAPLEGCLPADLLGTATASVSPAVDPALASPPDRWFHGSDGKDSA